VALCLAPQVVFGQTTKAKELPEASVINEIQTIKQADLLKLSKPFVVDGVTRFDGWFVVTDKVVSSASNRLYRWIARSSTKRPLM
jgi:hypothetical protein